VHAPLATLVVAPSLATLPCQHATCIPLDSTMLAFSAALPSPSPPSKRGVSRWEMAREEAQSAVGMSVHPAMPTCHLHPPRFDDARIFSGASLSFPALQEGRFAMGNGARRGAKCGGNERGFPSQAQHHHHATHAHTPRSWRLPSCARSEFGTTRREPSVVPRTRTARGSFASAVAPCCPCVALWRACRHRRRIDTTTSAPAL
jgi:hypothetical protein